MAAAAERFGAAEDAARIAPRRSALTARGTGDTTQAKGDIPPRWCGAPGPTAIPKVASGLAAVETGIVPDAAWVTQEATCIIPNGSGAPPFAPGILPDGT